MIHEAGHFLAAHILGLKVLNYYLPDAKPIKSQNLANMLGGVEIETDSSSQMTDWRSRFCTVWMAGLAAEQIYFPPDTEPTGGAFQDLKQLRICIADLPNPDLEERWAMLRLKI